MPSPEARPPDTIATWPVKPASSSGPFIRSPFAVNPAPGVSFQVVPLDAERIAPPLDVAGIGAGKVRWAKQGVALDAILQELAPRARRHLLVPAELARPVGMIDLNPVVHDVARKAGPPVALL